MKDMNETINHVAEKSSLNLAIVGGGKACKFFLELLRSESFNYLNVNPVGVCDINPDAEGLRLAREMGIFTTDNFPDLFKIKDLDIVIELTRSRDVLLEIIRLRPEGVGVLEHNVNTLLMTLFTANRRLKSAGRQVLLEKMASDYLVQQTNEQIIVLKPDFTIVEANEPYLKAVNKSQDEVIGAHCYEITHGLSVPCPSSQPELGCPMMETLRTGESAHVIHEHPTPGNNASYCDLVTYPLKGENGEIARVIEIWRDITEELSSSWERRVKLLKANLDKLVREDRLISLGRLVASSVHEINNPIQGLLTFSHLMQKILEEGDPSPQDLTNFRKYLSLMSNELERCGNIVSGLLSFSRQSTMEHTNVELNEILNDVVTLTRHKMELQNIRFNTELSPSPLVVFGDVNQLQQCFLNLIFNAIEAMPKGGQLSVVSGLDSTHKNAVVKIQDTGYGIVHENLNQIFDPFFTTKEEGEGTGLGLSIVYGIVKAHEGSVEVSSEAGKGSSFILKFPIRQPLVE